MAYISTSDEKNRILEKEKDKLQKEIKQKEKAIGLREMKPLKEKNEYEQLYDLKVEENNIKESMAYAKEQRIKKQEEEKKRKRKSFEENLKLYFAQVERKSKEKYNKRRIVFRDGGFDKFEPKIKMMSCRVLLKEIKKDEMQDGIVIPDIHENKNKFYKVIAIGEGCNEALRINDQVMVESYSGIEIVSKQDIYRIVTDSDILCIL